MHMQNSKLEILKWHSLQHQPVPCMHVSMCTSWHAQCMEPNFSIIILYLASHFEVYRAITMLRCTCGACPSSPPFNNNPLMWEVLVNVFNSVHCTWCYRWLILKTQDVYFFVSWWVCTKLYAFQTYTVLIRDYKLFVIISAHAKSTGCTADSCMDWTAETCNIVGMNDAHIPYYVQCMQYAMTTFIAQANG